MIKNTHSVDSNYITELESLRGIAILLVLTFHTYALYFKLYFSDFNNVLSKLFIFIAEGHTGVSLFFILSAFLLSQPFLKERRKGCQVSKKKFYTRRFLRIMPLYCVAVTLGMIFCYDRSDLMIKGVKALLFIPGSGGLTFDPFSATWWSLVTEIHFYAILPLFFMGIKGHLSRKLTYLILSVYAIIYLLFISGTIHIPPGKNMIILTHSILGRLPLFIIGIISATIYLSHGQKIKSWFEKSSWMKIFVIGDIIFFLCLFALGCLLYQVNRIGYYKADYFYLFWHVFEGIAWSGIMLLLLLMPLKVKPIFCNKAIGYLGTISYSIYLWHWPILVFGKKINALFGFNLLDNTIYFIFGFIPMLLFIIIAISTLSYRYIELPFLIRKARV